jgi:hypothetical protein
MRTWRQTAKESNRGPAVPGVAQRRRAGAPNVLLVLLDNVGFGVASAFGGPCHTYISLALSAGAK